MNRLWLLALAAGAPAALLLAIGQGCGSTTCDELADLCSSCPDETYQQQCERVADDGEDYACVREKQRFDLACYGTTTDGAVPDATTCEPGQTLCATGCTDLNDDPNNCGACQRVCASFCQLGACVESCVPPFEACGGSCVNLASDPSHCGDCSQICLDPVAVCDDGSCAAGCDPLGSLPTECNGGCVDLMSDVLNCGACGEPCQVGQVCSLGTCSATCQEGLTNCCGVCTDTASDPASCGGCDPIECPAAPTGDGGAGGGGGAPTGGEDCTASGMVCLRGECEVDCGALDNCAGACVDLRINAANCGACANPCAEGELCADGACVSACAAGETECLGGCVDTQSSSLNCGACGRVCAPGEVCSGGVCATQCDPGLTECPPLTGNCVDTTSNASFCGACDTPCPPTMPLCSDGTCVTGCPADETPCNGSCVDLDTSFNNCGSCGNSCNDDDVCTSDSCADGTCNNESFGATICDDNKKCTIDKCDPIAGCQHRPPTPAELDGLCGDDNPCTDTICDPDLGCTNLYNGGNPAPCADFTCAAPNTCPTCTESGCACVAC